MTDHDQMFSSYAPDPLTWLQGWYAAQCDGEWEHEYGVTLETLDNPGWFLKADLSGTEMDGVPLAKNEIHRAEHDWLTTRVVENRFEAACGPLNLGEAVFQFRVWVNSRRHRDS
jgi:hypothetical protein